MSIFASTPLLALVWVAYNGVVMAGSPEMLNNTLLTVELMSGATWTLNVAETLIVAGLLALYIEIFKSTRTSVGSVINHTLSTLVFIAFVVQFLMAPAAGNSTFFILGLMAFIDVIAGFTVTIVSARRDVTLAEPDAA